ncbi:3-deoxy-manno-octulosonate cytidylyltransferase [Oleiphilus messinensis]|uniref:3-deoxy-manno-octulosonate cytidylyltransferase n=1 Tax=Oleiphilus messinensis TaxID=141451 RepID=A0A1Y0I6N5_9GAMM|nr:3-deoxy-manno-octulosonate cytidylyltransferase [Oleiphilus messinensis]ARU56152.1 3-deoxy-manno-octulosonate cytidylyltransferase [Oleiphilus messinensis]
MSFSVVIPARYASSRLPGKPLLKIAGKPMIQHVYEKACESEATDVIIATDDARIEEAAQRFGAKTVMTSTEHPSGTDRLEEVVRKLGYYADDIVVNVQGDEPLIPPRIINQVAHNLAAEPLASISTLCEPIADVQSLINSNVVKVVFDTQRFALYFSRAPIPWPRNAFAGLNQLNEAKWPEGTEYFRHIGIYGYRVKFLKSFVQWAPSPLEQAECLEQLRALDNGERIHVDVADERPPAGVDTEEDFNRVKALLEA